MGFWQTHLPSKSNWSRNILELISSFKGWFAEAHALTFEWWSLSCDPEWETCLPLVSPNTVLSLIAFATRANMSAFLELASIPRLMRAGYHYNSKCAITTTQPSQHFATSRNVFFPCQCEDREGERRGRKITTTWKKTKIKGRRKFGRRKWEAFQLC